MHIFASELEDNISDNITNNTSIAYNMTIEKSSNFKSINTLSPRPDDDKEMWDIIRASIDDEQLYYHTAILVTSNWNKNDDVFRPDIIWAAKDTPINKPTNLGHDSLKIIGHMTNSWAVDDKCKILEVTKSDELPKKFHILVGSVIYKVWPSSEEYEKSIAELIDDIEKGEKYVSMECTFKSFDYALSSDEGVKFVERNEKTSFLSKYLRAYGGDGTYNNYKIGRAVNEISFCGKGYVDKPANPESVIFTKNDIADFSKAEIIKNFDEKILSSEKSGVILSNNEINSMENEMTDFYKEQVDELKVTNTTLAKSLEDIKEKLAASNVSKLEDEIKTLKAQTNDMSEVLTKKSDEITATKILVDTATTQVTTLTKANDELVKTNKELTEKIQAVEIEKRTVARVSTLVSGGFTKEEADAKVQIFASLDDAQFEVIAKEIIEAKKFVPFTKDGAKDDKKKTDDKKKENPGDAKAEDLDDVDAPKEDVASAGVDDGEFDITELAGKLSAALKTKDGDK